jgi:hypothetical protein
VQKGTVTERPVKEGWQEKIKAAEREAQEAAEKKARESIQEMNDRHIKTAQFVEKKALEDMRSRPFTSSMDAARALFMAMDKERLIRGQPTERLDVPAFLNGKWQALILKPGEEDNWDDDEAAPGDERRDAATE